MKKKESIFVNVVPDGGVDVAIEMGKDHLYVSRRFPES